MVESIGEVRLNGNASLASEVRVGREVKDLRLIGAYENKWKNRSRTAHLLTRDYSNSLRCNDSSSLPQT